jgi:hypothetical protein
MAAVSFEINGKEVKPGSIKDALDSLFLKHLHEQITEKVGTARCKKHGLEAAIKVTGNSIDNLHYEVSGCCRDFINETRKKFK